MDKLIELLECNPIILGIQSDEDLERAKQNEAPAVFVLYGNVSNITKIVSELKEAKKTVFVYIDKIEGFSVKNSVMEFMKIHTAADGIVSTKASLLRYAKELGFYTVHRFFVLDSASYRTIGKQLEISQADMINIVPGWTKVIEWSVNDHNKPVISAGLVCEKKIVIENLGAGAIAICSTNYEVWDL